jgi:hypothetical protein
MERIKDFLALLRRTWINIRYKFYGIKNIFVWIPTLVEDRHWDHTFILMILKKKLELTEKYMRDKGHHIYAEKDADDIKLAINLLGRLIQDNYMNNAFAPHKKRYGESHIMYKNIPNSKNTQLLIEYDVKINTEEEKKKEHDLFSSCYNREDYLRKQDLNLLFDHLKKHILSWWD